MSGRTQPGEDIIVRSMVTLFEPLLSISIILFPFLLIREHLYNKQSISVQPLYKLMFQEICNLCGNSTNTCSWILPRRPTALFYQATNQMQPHSTVDQSQRGNVSDRSVSKYLSLFLIHPSKPHFAALSVLADVTLTSYAAPKSANLSWAFGSSWFLSGCSWRASFLYAFLMSLMDALLLTPRIL